jgi:hypothetical protein
MTEEEWLAATDPRPMIGFLRGMLTDRKARLFTVACCRLISHLFADRQSQEAVAMGERYAEGKMSNDDLDGIWASVGNDLSDRVRDASWWADEAAEWAVDIFYKNGLVYRAAARAARSVINAKPNSVREQQALLRCIVGNPFRPVAIDPRWLTSTVADLARLIYDERAFDRLPILADALMDAGCDNDDVLNHCRSAGPHVRGCWVVDLLTGRK